MSPRLILIRHGNTFDKGDTILRVGCRTDLALSKSGCDQAVRLGQHFSAHAMTPDIVYVSPLRRTQETARIALREMGLDRDLHINPALNEIDYGPDDGKPETDVIARLGQGALDSWERDKIMPESWSPRPEQITASVSTLRDQIATRSDQTVWAVTSNGVARFFAMSCRWNCPVPHDLKLGTGAFSVMTYQDGQWMIEAWNQKPA